MSAKKPIPTIPAVLQSVDAWLVDANDGRDPSDETERIDFTLQYVYLCPSGVEREVTRECLAGQWPDWPLPGRYEIRAITKGDGNVITKWEAEHVGFSTESPMATLVRAMCQEAARQVAASGARAERAAKKADRLSERVDILEERLRKLRQDLVTETLLKERAMADADRYQHQLQGRKRSTVPGEPK